MAGRGPGAGRWVEVAPERFGRWTGTFAARHGGAAAMPGPAVLTLRAADGATAECHLPFPPVPWPPGSPAAKTGDTAEDAAGAGPGGLASGAGDAGALGAGAGDVGAGAVAAGGAGAGDVGAVTGWADLAAAHAAASRTVGVLLVRLGGYAAGVFAGDPPSLLASKTGSRLVHGRSAAGGWSQQRFARRRENQAAQALSAAAGTAVAVLGPYQQRLDAVVLGGDRRAVSGLRSDPRLRPYLDRAEDRFLTTPDPKLAVLRDAPRLFRAVRIYLTEPAEAP